MGESIVELLVIKHESEFEKILLKNQNLLIDGVILFYSIINPMQFERSHNLVI